MNESLNVDKEYKIKLEDNFLKHIGYEYVENLCNELEEQKEEWKDIRVPESLDNWFQIFLKQEIKRKRKSNRNKAVIRYLKKAAIVILFIVAVNYFLITTVEAYRIQFFKVVVSIQEKFTQIDYETNNHGNVPGVPENWSGFYYLSSLPMGYKLSEYEVHDTIAYIKYLDDRGNWILLHQYLSQSSLQIDSENAVVTSIIVNGEEAILLEKEANVKIISWVQDEKAFCLETNNTKLKEMIKIVENVKIFE